jgi:type I restriction enzyme S subunit
MKTNAPNSENLEVRSEKRDQDSYFSISNSHFSLHPPALVPKVRFPEFRGKEAWKPVTLDEASTPVTERVGERKLTPVSISAGIGFVPQAEKFGRDISGNQYQLYTLVRDGDFVFNKGNSLKFPQGCVYQLKGWGEVAAPNVFICFRLKKGYSDGFFQQCFEQNQHGRELKRHITSGARSNGLLNISKETFFGVEIPTPSPAEQQKIAECLSSVDELMAAQARKVDALKTHKKGLMQQLFPREGETQPRLRFPEFQNAGAWEETELGRLISIKGRIGYRGYTVADIVNAGEGAISLSPSNITESGVLSFHKATYITWAKYHESPEIIVEREQTLLVKTGSTFGKVAYVSDLPQECTVNPQIVVLKPHSIHPYFLFLLVFSEVIQTKIRAIVVGGAIPTLSQEAVSKFKIRVPAKDEQRRIATCLSSLDALITGENQKLETLKTHKRGLMQQLYPQETGSENLEVRSEK